MGISLGNARIIVKLMANNGPVIALKSSDHC